jgi:hypothetical protein
MNPVGQFLANLGQFSPLSDQVAMQVMGSMSKHYQWLIDLTTSACTVTCTLSFYHW